MSSRFILQPGVQLVLPTTSFALGPQRNAQIVSLTAAPIQLLTVFGPDGQISAEHESLLRWIDAEDPALVARIPNVAMPDKVDVPFRPSYSTMRTAPLSLPTEAPAVLFPPARDAIS